jgi:hypothetical protein
MTSLFQDPEFLAKLLKIGQGRTLDPAANVSPIQAQSQLGLKLLDRLQKEYSPFDPETTTVSTQSDNAAQLTPTALESIGALSSFLAHNQITVNGKLPVYDHDPGQEGYQFYRLEGNALYAEPESRQEGKVGLWINPELLSAYLTSLQAQEAKKPNKVLETYLHALIQESNKLLGTKLSPTYQSQTDKTKQPGSETGTISGQKMPGQDGANQQAANPQMNANALQELASLRPFNSQYINIDEILLFVSKYAALANKPAISQAAAQLQTSAGMANEVLTAPRTPVPMNNMTPDNFRLLCKNGARAKLLANYLYTVVSFAERIYQDFVTSFEGVFTPQEARPLKQQIAPGGPAMANISTLQRLMSLL